MKAKCDICGKEFDCRQPIDEIPICKDCEERGIDIQGDIDDDFDERSEGIERSSHGPMTGYF